MEPKIRIKGFEGTWMQTTWGKLTNNFKYGINAAAAPYDGQNKYLRITDIEDTSRVFMQDNLTTPGTDLTCCNEYIMQDGDIVIARTGASVGKSYIYHEKDGKVYFAGFLIRMRLNDDVDKDFVFQNTLTDSYAKHIKIVSQRSGQPGVNVDELKAYTLSMPINKNEQQALGSYFKHLDSLIQSTTKKIESLKQVKAASLQSMFPQEGETKPRVRFKGFEGEWETVALEMICKKAASILSENSLGNNSGQYPVYGASGYIQNIQTYDFSCQYIGLIKDGSGVGRSQLYPAFSSILGTMQYILPKDAIIVSFLSYLFQTIDFSIYVTGSSIPHIYFKDYCKEITRIPLKAEQQAIASYFTNLDNQISLQTQRLEKLKQIKSACLDNMFV